MKLKKLFPLFFLPTYWFADKKEKRKKYIEYYYEGREKEIKLCEIFFENDCFDKELKLLEIEKKYSNMDEYDFEIKKLNLKLKYNLLKNREEYEFLKNDLNLKYKKISEKEYKKIKNSLEKLPWFDVSAELLINEENGDVNVALEFDWNEYFIEYLSDIGYREENEIDMINRWFFDLIYSSIEDEDIFDENFSNRDFIGKNLLRKINRKDFQSKKDGMTDISEYS